MFKSVKSKIVSFLVVVAALIQTGRAETQQREPMRERVSVTATKPATPSIPWGGIVGTTMAGLLAAAGSVRSCGNYTSLAQAKTENPKEAPVPVGLNISDEARRKFIQEINKIKAERAKLTCRMAKARKKEADSDEINKINAKRKGLSKRRRKAFQTVMGSVAKKIKDERRALTKQMTLAKREKRTDLKEAIQERRAELKRLEAAAKAEVRAIIMLEKRSKRTSIIRSKQGMEHSMAA